MNDFIFACMFGYQHDFKQGIFYTFQYCPIFVRRPCTPHIFDVRNTCKQYMNGYCASTKKRAKLNHAFIDLLKSEGVVI